MFCLLWKLQSMQFLFLGTDTHFKYLRFLKPCFFFFFSSHHFHYLLYSSPPPFLVLITTMERAVRRRKDGQTLLSYISNKIKDFKVEDDFEKHKEEVENLLLGLKVRFTYKARRLETLQGCWSKI